MRVLLVSISLSNEDPPDVSVCSVPSPMWVSASVDVCFLFNMILKITDSSLSVDKDSRWFLHIFKRIFFTLGSIFSDILWKFRWQMSVEIDFYHGLDSNTCMFNYHGLHLLTPYLQNQWPFFLTFCENLDGKCQSEWSKFIHKACLRLTVINQ